MRIATFLYVLGLPVIAAAVGLALSQQAQAEAGDCSAGVCTPTIDLYVDSVTAVSNSNERLVIAFVDGQGAVYNVCNGAGAVYAPEVFVPCADKEHDSYLDLAKTALATGKPVRVKAKANTTFFGIGSTACQLVALTLH